MPTPLNVNGVTFDYPTTGETGWGAAATGWATAITNGTLQKAGGLFSLSSDIDFGPSAGLKSLYFSSRTAGAANTGVLRLANNESLTWRNQANTADFGLAVNASNTLAYSNASSVNALTVDQNGNVGIGTPASARLDVLGANLQDTEVKIRSNSITNISRLAFADTTGNTATIAGYNSNTGGNSYAMTFGVNGAERMRINSTGNVAINTSPSTLYKFAVTGGAFIQNTNTTGDPGYGARVNYFQNGTAQTTGFTIGHGVIGQWNNINGGQGLASWLVAASPNSTTASFGVFGQEVNPINCSSDMGYAKRRGVLPRWTGGIQVVPEANDLTGRFGNNCYNTLYGLAVTPSGGVTAGGDNAKTYNGFLVEQDAIAPGGRGVLVSGDTSANPAKLPNFAVEVDNRWDSALYTVDGTFVNNDAINLGSGQRIVWGTTANPCYVKATTSGDFMEIGANNTTTLRLDGQPAQSSFWQMFGGTGTGGPTLKAIGQTDLNAIISGSGNRGVRLTTGDNTGLVEITGGTGFKINTNNETQMIIDNNGNVGFGTGTFPYVAAGRTIVAVNNTTSSMIDLQVGSGTRGYLAASSTDIELFSNGALKLSTNGSERMRVDTSGYVYVNGAQGLGLTGIYRFQVAGSCLSIGDGLGFRALNSSNSAGISLTSNAGSGSGGTLDSEGGPIRFVTTGSERMRVDTSGNLIQSAPTAPPALTVNNQMVFNLVNNTTLRVSVRGTDGVTRTANITLA
jgi:hypothetical protein